MRGSREVVVRARVLAIGVAAVVLVAASPAGEAPERHDHDFPVINPDDGTEHILQGYRVDPACDADTAVLLLHGLSYTGEAWDVPDHSYARILAEAGYTTFAPDRLGYGDSVLDDGRDVSIVGHADMAAQMTTQLSKEFDHVVLAGHSAGAETVISAVGLFGAPADALVPMGYTTYPDPEFLANDWVPGDQLRALQDDYVYFLGTPEHRAAMFYTDNADPDVVAADTEAAVLTPSGEIQTISFQPSRLGAALVDVPVLAQLAEQDRLFPSAFADLWAAQFASSPSTSVDVVPGTGHTYMLHHEGPAAAERVAAWLAEVAELGGCTVTASPTTPSPPPSSERPGQPAPAATERTLPATGGGAGFTVGAVLLAVVAGRRRRRA